MSLSALHNPTLTAYKMDILVPCAADMLTRQGGLSDEPGMSSAHTALLSSTGLLRDSF